MNYNYYMGLELLGSFQGLSSGVGLLMSLSGFTVLLFVCLLLAAFPLPTPFLVYCFYEMIVNKPVRIVFAKNSEVPFSKCCRSSSPSKVHKLGHICFSASPTGAMKLL